MAYINGQEVVFSANLQIDTLDVIDINIETVNKNIMFAQYKKYLTKYYDKNGQSVDLSNVENHNDIHNGLCKITAISTTDGSRATWIVAQSNHIYSESSMATLHVKRLLRQEILNIEGALYRMDKIWEDNSVISSDWQDENDKYQNHVYKKNEINKERDIDNDTYYPTNAAVIKYVDDYEVNAIIKQSYISDNGINLYDSANAKLKGLRLFGATVLNGIPSIENPATFTHRLQNQSVLISTHDNGTIVNIVSFDISKGILGIPVSSNGIYTDMDKQQWICDEIDVVRGKYIRRIGKITNLSGYTVSVTNPQEKDN